MGTVRYTSLDGEIIAEKRNGVRRSYLPDAIGSTLALLDNTQTQTDTFTYWPYGEVKNRTGSTATPFGYGGTMGCYTDLTGRTYMPARHLSTTEGRWISSDTLGGRTSVMLPFAYAANSPVTLTDPTGKIAIPIWIGYGILCGLISGGTADFIVRRYGERVGHCVATCLITSCGTRALAWLIGWINELDDPSSPESRQDRCANNRGEWCAEQGKSLSNCVGCCTTIYWRPGFPQNDWVPRDGPEVP